MANQIDEFKSKANAAFSLGNNEDAISLYTQAIELDETNHILYSNRSAAYTKLNKYEDALKDAEKCISLKPDFVKGYSRKGAALSYLKRYDESISTYEEGLKIDPNNAQLKTDLETVRRDSAERGSNFFTEPKFIDALKNNAKAQELLKDPETAEVFKKLQEQPNDTSLLRNKKLMRFIGTVLDFTVKTPEGNETESKKSTTTTKKDEPEVSTSQQNPAEQEKEKGNEAYKIKDFQTALEHYNAATEIDPKNMIYYTNRAAVYFEQKRWDDCIKECEKAIEIGRENKADYKLIARAYSRIGNVKFQEKDYQSAVKYFNHSLSEHRNPDILKRKQETENLIKQQEKSAYINPELAEEEKVKGNEFFQKADYPTALKHYTEAIKRNPSDPKLYSNRSACYTKLMEFTLALKDCEEGIKIDPKFIKCYLRKGHVLIAMKDFSQARSTFSKAIEIDPNCQEALDGYRKCSTTSNDNKEEVLRRAASDPEIQSILSDPGMRLILEQMQNDPQALRDHLKNPDIAQKIQKLINSGVIGIQ